MLQRSFIASQTFAKTLLETPSCALPYLTFGAWSGWFYSTLLVMKIVLLQHTGRSVKIDALLLTHVLTYLHVISTGTSRVANVPHAIGDLLPQDIGTRPALEICSLTTSLAHASLRDGATTVEECELATTFQLFITKLKTAAPSQEDTNFPSAVTPFLAKVATLQSGLLSGLEIMIAKHNSTTLSTDTSHTLGEEIGGGISSNRDSKLIPNQYQDLQPLLEPMPYIKPSNFAYTDNSGFHEYQSLQEHPIDDWIWDLVRNDDCNMFSV
jgi:hypothetical protein